MTSPLPLLLIQNPPAWRLMDWPLIILLVLCVVCVVACICAVVLSNRAHRLAIEARKAAAFALSVMKRH